METTETGLQEAQEVEKKPLVGYIGDRGIVNFTAVGDGSFVNVEFEDGHKVDMSGTLFFHLKTDEEGSGSVTDSINHYFAKRFIAELATHNLDYYLVENVGMAMRVLAHNLREVAIKKAFDCTGSESIPLQKLIPEHVESL